MDDSTTTDSHSSNVTDVPSVNTSVTRSRSSSRKRQLSSNSDTDLLKPPASRPRSVSVSRQSTKGKSSIPTVSPDSPVIFKTQGESFNMSKLVQSTLLQPEVCQNIIPSLLKEIKSELINDLKTEIKLTVSEAVEKLVFPLRQAVNEQETKIESLITNQEQMKKQYDSEIHNMHEKYEKFRNMANAISKCMSENQRLSNETTRLSEDNIKLMTENKTLKEEVSALHSNVEELEQYGRRTSLRFHNVPMTSGDLQRTDELVVSIVNDTLKMDPPITTDDINRSHIIGRIQDGKGQLICRLRNWKIKNSIYFLKKNLKNNPSKIFITEDLTKFRQSLVKDLNIHKRQHKIHSFWTFDGRIFAKKLSTSNKVVIAGHRDISELLAS